MVEDRDEATDEAALHSAPVGGELAPEQVGDWWQDDDDAVERIADEVARVGTAPDPYEEYPVARRVALADLGHAERPFGLGRMPRGFAQLAGADKLDLLLDLKDPRATVQALACEEFVFLVKDIGLSDAAPLLALASPRQLQASVDLDAWRNDGLDHLALAHWLAAAMTAGDDVTDRFVASIGDDVWNLFLGASLQVFETAEESEDYADPDAQIFLSPGNDFAIAVAHDDPMTHALRAVINVLYRTSVERGRALIRSLRWELPSQLEEESYQLRNRRIADYGFVDVPGAREFYLYVNPDELKAELDTLIRGETQSGEVPRPFVVGVEPLRTGLALVGYPNQGLLAQALETCPAAHQARLHHALIRLAYRAQAARAQGLVEFDELPRWSRHALTTCDMGLSYASEGNIEVAALLLQMVPLDRLFQLGHGLAVRLHHRARALRKLLGGAAGVDLLEPDDAALLAGLLLPLPELALWPAPTPGGDDERRAATRSFETLAEIEQAEGRLAAMAAVARLLSALADAPLVVTRDLLARDMADFQASDVRLTSMLATAIAWTVLEGAPQLAPLSLVQGRDFLQQAFEVTAQGRRIAAPLRKALVRSLFATPAVTDAELGGLEAFVLRTLDRLDEELGGLDPALPFEARFVGAALVIVDR